jgi:hypothetical protein
MISLRSGDNSWYAVPGGFLKSIYFLIDGAAFFSLMEVRRKRDKKVILSITPHTYMFGTKEQWWDDGLVTYNPLTKRLLFFNYEKPSYYANGEFEIRFTGLNFSTGYFSYDFGYESEGQNNVPFIKLAEFRKNTERNKFIVKDLTKIRIAGSNFKEIILKSRTGTKRIPVEYLSAITNKSIYFEIVYKADYAEVEVVCLPDSDILCAIWGDHEMIAQENV